MPFKSEKQRRYLWANEPEIARDWTETYGSKIKKASGGRINKPQLWEEAQYLIQKGASNPSTGELFRHPQEAFEFLLKKSFRSPQDSDFTIPLPKELENIDPGFTRSLPKELENIDPGFTIPLPRERSKYYSGGQSIPSEYTVEDARKTAMQDKLGGITDIMKKADLYRQGDVGQMYMADGGKISMQGGVKNYLGEQPMVSAPKYWQSAPDHEMTELAYITPRERDVLVNMDMYGTMQGSPNEGPSGIMSLNGWGDKDQGFGSPGGGTAGTGGHGYGDQERSYTRSMDAGRGTETVTVSPKDHFEQSWSGQPGFLGLGGGYRNLKTPGVTPARGGAYQSRLNPMGIMGLLGKYMKQPFTIAATGFNSLRDALGTGINTLRNRFGSMYDSGRNMLGFGNYFDTLSEEEKRRIANLQMIDGELVDTRDVEDTFGESDPILQNTSFQPQNLYVHTSPKYLNEFIDVNKFIPR
jgi:hypothetical protein